MKKVLKRFIYTLPLIFAIILTSLFYLLNRTIPYGDGILEMPILSDKVEVIRDTEGIPHITAKNSNDAYKVLGYTMASERLFQMEMLRRVGAGRISELVGSKGITIDKTFRTLGLRRHFEEQIKKKELPKEIKEKMDSFFAGVNYFIENEDLPIEFVLGGFKPEKFTLLDSYSVIGYMAYSFAAFLRHDLLMDKLKNSLNEEMWDDLQIEPHKNTVMTASVHKELKNIFKAFEDVNNDFGGFEGSNAWALSSKKTKSKKAMLASDPHIGFSLPGIWFEAHLKIEDPSEPYEIYGHFLPNIPFAVMGHDKLKAWGITISYMDDMDFYKETFSESGNETIFEGKEIPLIRYPEVIKVRGGEDIQLPVHISHNGPILDGIMEDKGISMKWTYFLESNHPIEGFYKMGQAKNLEEFKKGVSLVGSPGLNIIYADAEDNIARLNLGAYPKRNDLSDSRVVLDGSSKDDAYTGYYQFDELPHNINPESGFVASANNRPITADENFRGMWQPRDRFINLFSRLMAKNDWSLGDTMLLQNNVLNNENEWIRDLVVKELDSSKLSPLEVKAYKELQSWDRQTFPNRIGASIYHQFMYHLTMNILDELGEEDRNKFCGLSARWYFLGRMLKRDRAAWWDIKDTEQVETRKEVILKSFKDTVTFLNKKLGEDINEWNWGKLHTIEFTHALGKSFPLNKILNLGPYPVMGAYNNINNFRKVGCKDGHKVKSGPSTRRIIDFANPEMSYGILPLGISGHYLSPFFKNQMERFLSGKYRLQIMSDDLLMKHFKTKLEIVPQYK